MTIPDSLRPFWEAFKRARNGVSDAQFYDVCTFGDSAELIDELAELVLRGTKRATTGAMWAYEAEGCRVPRPGDLSIVTNAAGDPLCVIETRTVEVVRFDAVTADFAAAEGEGDGSLAYWQESHRAYFERECAQAGRHFSPDMRVACERFDVVYQPVRGEHPPVGDSTA
ncbi:ASCH domain-containing protein [Niveibacterium microcysteis]|uniref:ASCH domain-containing protein n=1 Tax=Niveibacterium microcysteis TaxID=2811415 RepID=A0ABX7MCK0_9RHOO|nr:ASCH domain-containing protein [Niveibacterium microcysteis]QSI78523.1 ASCH domain-containing protein [Niveibacterium microcysteis]